MRRDKSNPKREFFCLRLDGSVPSLEKLPNRGVFAVYDSRPSRLIPLAPCFVVQGLSELRERLKPLSQSDTRDVFVESAESEADLTDWDYEHVVWQVLQGIETIKGRGDRITLRRVRAAIERKGEKPGPKADPKQNASLVAVLKELATGKLLKQVSLQKPYKHASVSAKLSPFCWKFYQFCTLFRASSPSEWQAYNVARLIRERFGFSFPDDLTAAEEAFRRGKAQLTPEERQWEPFRVRCDFRQL